MRSLFVAALISGLLVLATAGLVLAAEPANQGCVGESLSAVAGPGWGQTTAAFAQQPNWPGDGPGLGQELQAFQAGLTPDFIVPNTCNG